MPPKLVHVESEFSDKNGQLWVKASDGFLYKVTRDYEGNWQIENMLLGRNAIVDDAPHAPKITPRRKSGKYPI